MHVVLSGVDQGRDTPPPQTGNESSLTEVTTDTTDRNCSL